MLVLCRGGGGGGEVVGSVRLGYLSARASKVKNFSTSAIKDLNRLLNTIDIF